MFKIGDKIKSINKLDKAIYTVINVNDEDDILTIFTNDPDEQIAVDKNLYELVDNSLPKIPTIGEKITNVQKEINAKKELVDKSNNKKPEYHLLPWMSIDEVIKVLTYGKEKYGQYNFSNGSQDTVYISACMRHIKDYMTNNDYDKESGLHSLAHAASNLLMLLDNILIQTNIDDRNKKYNK